MKWCMNINAGLDSGPYHIHVGHGLFSLTYNDTPLGEYAKPGGAYKVAQAHLEAMEL